MKKFYIYIIVCIGIQISSKAQTNFKFDYDASGNVIQKSIQTIPISFRVANNPQEVNEKTTINSIVVFPNPTTDEVQITGPLPNNTSYANVLLANNQGVILYKSNYQGTNISISLSNFSNGIYYLTLEYSDKTKEVHKVILSK